MSNIIQVLNVQSGATVISRDPARAFGDAVAGHLNARGRVESRITAKTVTRGLTDCKSAG
jgi:hypothetical protein